MMHYCKGWLVQGRVYPQANDGATNLYDKFRGLFQAIWSTCLGVDNNWSDEGEAQDYDETIDSYGVHYRDYLSFEDCNVTCLQSYDSMRLSSGSIKIGHSGICQYCGKEYSRDSYLDHHGSYYGCGLPSNVADETTMPE